MKAIVFDLFETLVTEWGRHKYTKKQIAEELRVDAEAFSYEWEKLHEARYLGKYQDTESVIKHIVSVLNAEAEPQLISEISIRRENNKREVFINIDPCIVEMLKRLKENGYKTGLISNCSPEEITGLRDSIINQYFDEVTLSCNIGFTKPDPKIYEACINKLRVSYSECLYVGDGGSSELEGAAHLCMVALRAVWYTKKFISNFDKDKTYPLLYNPEELFEYTGIMQAAESFGGTHES